MFVNIEHLATAVWGFAVGDALGVPYEFSKRGTFECTGIERRKIPYQRFFLPAGVWSDDTALSLCLLDALAFLPDKEASRKRLISNMKKWLFLGKFSATHTPPFDVGVSTFKGIIAETLKIPNRRAKKIKNNGNGGLMRCFPIAFIDTKNDEEILEYIKLYNDFTHGHDISNTACLMYIRCLKAVMNGKSLEEAIEESYQIKNFDTDVFPKLNVEFLKKCSEDEISSSGYVVDTLTAVYHCLLNADNYKDAVLKAVNLGHDTDTIAALVGCIAGVYYGSSAIPAGWYLELKNKKLIDEKINLIRVQK